MCLCVCVCVCVCVFVVSSYLKRDDARDDGRQHELRHIHHVHVNEGGSGSTVWEGVLDVDGQVEPLYDHLEGINQLIKITRLLLRLLLY